MLPLRSTWASTVRALRSIGCLEGVASAGAAGVGPATGASILAVGYLLPMLYLTWAMRYGEVAGRNPWPATGLEWQTESPPPTENFDKTPEVTWEPYDFHHRPDLGLASPGLAPARGDD